MTHNSAECFYFVGQGPNSLLEREITHYKQLIVDQFSKITKHIGFERNNKKRENEKQQEQFHALLEKLCWQKKNL
jgi:hypothetical protein